MAIDPAPVDVFEPGTFAEISIPVEIVNLGKPGTIPATADAAGVAKGDCKFEILDHPGCQSFQHVR
ncbi:hypothetical protein [Rhizobium tumorigenes]|uniref:hypothetical protein n=1 Tax=Rhizobium tumorigenes TaxID=2041385 RepID=UPI003100DAD9